MTDFADFFLAQAAASPHVQFVYDLTAGRVTFVNAAYEQVLHRSLTEVNSDLPILLAQLHPDDRAYPAHYW